MKIDLYISKEAPQVKKGAAWLKPVTGGFALYVLNNGWEPLKLVDDKGTVSEGDDTVAEATSALKSELIGTTEDTYTANTINGAKATANDIALGLLGTEGVDDTATPTLWGLKKYIDDQIAALE